MKLYRILVTNLLLWGIPGIPAYVFYKISQPFVHNGIDFTWQVIGIIAIYIVLILFNFGIYWEHHYHVYLHEPDKPKEEKHRDGKKLI